MSLGYLLKKFPRLSETFVLREILAQEERGRGLCIFARHAPDAEPRHPDLARLRAPVVTLPNVRELDPWSTMFPADGTGRELLGQVERLAREAASWDHPRFPSLLGEALDLLPRLAERGVRHVHVHFAADAAVVAHLAWRLGGPSYSITAHAKDIYRETVATGLLERLFSGAEFVVTVCDANLRYLAERLQPGTMERVRRLYNGVDLTAHAGASEDPALRESDHVLAVGRLVEKKGFDVLIDALAILRRLGRPARATIVGEGEQRPALEQSIESRGLDGAVRLAGPLDQAAVGALMSRATVLCLPSVVGADGNRDALPTVLVEALASGLPVVSTPIAGIPEILDEGRAGVLVAAGDAAATARALADLLADADRRRELGSRGRAHAARHFDLWAAAQTLGGWFDEALVS